jgi:hypothetical protein
MSLGAEPLRRALRRNFLQGGRIAAWIEGGGLHYGVRTTKLNDSG